jgi:MFS family permease
MIAWYRDLRGKERRTLWTCFGGWALDGLDVQLYSFVMPTLIMLWGLTATQAGLMATSALVLSALGGWLAGILADRIGRVRLLQITVAWFAFFTFLAGFTQSFEQLLIVRGLQGLGFGGEWVAGSVLIGEVIQARHRGKAVGFVQSAWAVGWALAALFATAAFHLLPEELAWRVLFFIGLLPAFAIFFVRRLVEEPDVFLRQRAQSALHGRGSMLVIFAKDLRSTTLLGSLLAIGAQGGYHSITTWLPTYLRTERHLSVLDTAGYLAVIILGSFLGYIVSAYLSDLIGRRRNFVTFAVGSTIVVIGYTQLNVSDGLMLILGLPLGFFASGIFSGMGPLYTELFPTHVRASGQGFCYNFGRGIAAFFPALVGWLASLMPLGKAIGILTIGAYAIVVFSALRLPDTAGRELE